MGWNSHGGKVKSKANCDKRSIIGSQQQEITINNQQKKSDKILSKNLEIEQLFIFLKCPFWLKDSAGSIFFYRLVEAFKKGSKHYAKSFSFYDSMLFPFYLPYHLERDKNYQITMSFSVCYQQD